MTQNLPLEPGTDAVVVVGPDSGPGADPDGMGAQLSELVEQPAKVMRVGSMIKQLLEEVRNAPLDEAAGAASAISITAASPSWRTA